MLPELASNVRRPILECRLQGGHLRSSKVRVWPPPAIRRLIVCKSTAMLGSLNAPSSYSASKMRTRILHLAMPVTCDSATNSQVLSADHHQMPSGKTPLVTALGNSSQDPRL